jgi:hypothetical protein
VATDVSSEAAIAVEAGALEHEPKRRRLYRTQFLVVYLILAAALLGTGAGVVIATYGVSLKSAPPWSSWKPSGSAGARTSAIAQHIGGAYVFPNGDQLLDVFPKNLTLPVPTASGQVQVPIAGIAIRGRRGKVDKLAALSDSDTRIYQLCGTGVACAIGEGKASVPRGQLVRREALEIALYTFKYVPGITHVLAFLPPPPGKRQGAVVYLEKADVNALLGRPLTATLSAKTPFPSTITVGEGAKVDRLTLPHFYAFSLNQTQLGQAVLVLAPPA